MQQHQVTHHVHLYAPAKFDVLDVAFLFKINFKVHQKKRKTNAVFVAYAETHTVLWCRVLPVFQA